MLVGQRRVLKVNVGGCFRPRINLRPGIDNCPPLIEILGFNHIGLLMCRTGWSRIPAKVNWLP